VGDKVKSSERIKFIVVFLMLPGAGTAFLTKGYAKRKQLLSEKRE
jgi:hypothetical protein